MASWELPDDGEKVKTPQEVIDFDSFSTAACATVDLVCHDGGFRNPRADA
jgi:hypothetical protein